MKKTFSLFAAFIIAFSSFPVNGQGIAPPQDDYDCSWTVFDHGGMLQMCDNGRGVIYSSVDPAGGCSGAFSNCWHSIQL